MGVSIPLSKGHTGQDGVKKDQYSDPRLLQGSFPKAPVLQVHVLFCQLPFLNDSFPIYKRKAFLLPILSLTAVQKCINSGWANQRDNLKTGEDVEKVNDQETFFLFPQAQVASKSL